jgi:type VI secretion system protein ImpB
VGKESTQTKLDRVRKPRVQIKYEVFIDGAMELKELPFVVGVMGDYSGKPAEALPPLKNRKFMEIDRDNFDKVLAGQKPRLAFRVADKLSGDENSELNVELKFQNLADFKPENVVKQVEPLRKLLETRDKLRDLASSMDGNDKMAALLDEIVKNNDRRDEVAKSLGIKGGEDKDPA